MKQIVWTIICGVVTAVILIGSLSAMVESHKGGQGEHAAVTHSARSH
jgi:hypothetical protein